MPKIFGTLDKVLTSVLAERIQKSGSMKLKTKYDNLKTSKFKIDHSVPNSREILAMVYENVMVSDAVFSMVNVDKLKNHHWKRNDPEGVEEWKVTHAKLSEAVPLEEYSEQQRLDNVLMKMKYSAAPHFKDKINRFYDPLPEDQKNMNKIYEIIDKWLAEERDADTYTSNPEYVKALGLSLKESRRGRNRREWERDN